MTEANYASEALSALGEILDLYIVFIAISALYGAGWVKTISDNNSKVFNWCCVALLWLVAILALVYAGEAAVKIAYWAMEKSA